MDLLLAVKVLGVVVAAAWLIVLVVDALMPDRTSGPTSRIAALVAGQPSGSVGARQGATPAPAPSSFQTPAAKGFSKHHAVSLHAFPTVSEEERDRIYQRVRNR